MKTALSITLVFGLFLATAVAQETSHPPYIEELFSSISENLDEMNHQFSQLYHSKQYNFVIYDLQTGKVTIGFHPKYSAMKVAPLVKHHDDPFIQELLKKSKKFVTVTLSNDHLGPLLMYFTNVAKAVQFKILEEEFFDQQSSGKSPEQNSQKGKDEKKKNMLEILKNLSLGDFTNLMEKYGFDKVKDLPQQFEEKFKGVKEQILEKMNSMTEKLQKMFNRKQNSQRTKGNGCQGKFFTSTNSTIEEIEKQLIRKQQELKTFEKKLEEEKVLLLKEKQDIRNKAEELENQRENMKEKIGKKMKQKEMELIAKEEKLQIAEEDLIKRKVYLGVKEKELKNKLKSSQYSSEDIKKYKEELKEREKVIAEREDQIEKQEDDLTRRKVNLGLKEKQFMKKWNEIMELQQQNANKEAKIKYDQQKIDRQAERLKEKEELIQQIWEEYKRSSVGHRRRRYRMAFKNMFQNLFD